MTDRLPGLYVAMILQAAAPPVISAPTLAALMGLDAALSLATLIVCTAATPFTAPVFVALFVGDSMALSPIVLGTKLLALLLGAGDRRNAGAPCSAAANGSRVRASGSTGFR